MKKPIASQFMRQGHPDYINLYIAVMKLRREFQKTLDPVMLPIINRLARLLN